MHLHLCVDLSDGRYTLVLEGGAEGVDEELQHVFVAQDLDPSSDGPKLNLANKGKPQIINPVFYNYAIMFFYDCAFTFRS
jgi:hypothetical protein